LAAWWADCSDAGDPTNCTELAYGTKPTCPEAE
jgi:hypothetical protein